MIIVEDTALIVGCLFLAFLPILVGMYEKRQQRRGKW